MTLNITKLLLLLIWTSCISKSTESNTVPEVEEQNMIAKFDSDYVMGKFDPAIHEDFVEISTLHASKAGLFLRKDTYESFKKMHAAAALEGIPLIINSATRNFDYQKGIWERKWNGGTTLSDGTKATDIEDEKERALKILLYSSMPGSSRHHWGTDMDLNAFNNEHFSSGEGLRMYQWMQKNAHAYGFCQPYTDKKDGRTGYEEEKWHWSYSPVSKELTRYCKLNLTNEMIKGFVGASTAKNIDVVNNYVLGINEECQ
jgi:LAS superfamily LD-carboxypeptidase LdcB